MALIIGGISTILFGLFFWRLGRGMARLHDDMTRDPGRDN